jgi:type III secretion protein O
MPQYPLQVLLDLRERKKEECEQALGQAMGILTQETKKLQQLQEELERIIHEREERQEKFAEKALNEQTKGQEARNQEIYMNRLRLKQIHQQESINAQRAIVAMRQKDVDLARKALIKADQDLKAIEKHKERFQEEAKKALMMKEEELGDEIAQTIFLRNEQEKGDSNTGE